jgi:hypothetical protein
MGNGAMTVGATRGGLRRLVKSADVAVRFAVITASRASLSRSACLYARLLPRSFSFRFCPPRSKLLPIVPLIPLLAVDKNVTDSRRSCSVGEDLNKINVTAN